MFETSRPSNRQIMRAEHLLSKLGPKKVYSPDSANILERKRIKRSLG
tara:strand:- start:608 stop:748 length:141 start_codon:yes stop_codon:yes gene_type:complete